MYHYVYKLENYETGEYYFGSRTCRNHPSLDCYLGSMKVWKPEKKKLIKTILEYNFVNRDDAIEYEKNLIKDNINHPLNRNYSIPDRKFYTHPNCYDLKEHQKGEKNSQFGTCWIHNQNGENKKLKRSEILPNGWMYGRSIKYNYTQLDLYDKKIHRSCGRNQKGENNTQFGTHWITNGTDIKKIKNNTEIPIGWRRGYINKKMKDHQWITNGLENKRQHKDIPIPENWYKGKIQRKIVSGN